MGDARNMTVGIEVETDEADRQLQKVEERLGAIQFGVKQAENGAQEMGARFAGAAGEMSGASGRVGSDFAKIGREAESFGNAVHKSMVVAVKETDSMAAGIKASFQGAFAYSQKQFMGFVGKLKAGGNALLHPIQAIKGKLVTSLDEAGDSAKNLGSEADRAGGKLKDAGSEGAGAGDKIKDAFAGAIKTMLGIEAVKKGIELIGKLCGSSISAAMSVENIGAKFDAVFGDKAADAQKWTDNFASAIHRSDDEVKTFLTSSQAMYNSMGMTGEAANDLSKMTTSLGYDFGAAFKMDDAEAVTALQDAVKGNNDALAEFGVRLDDVTVKEKARQMGIVGELDELDAATLAQVRFNSILEQTEGVQRAAIEQTDGITNSTKGLKGIWNGFLADAGAKFTPMIGKLFGAISENWPIIEPMLMGFVSTLSEGMGQAVPVLIELGQTLIPVLTNVLGTLFQAATPLLTVFGNLAQIILPPLASILGMLGQSLLPPLTQILDTLNTAVIQPLVPPLIQIAQALLPPIGKLLMIVSPILSALSPVIGALGGGLAFIAEVLGNVIGWLADGVEAVTDFFSGLFGGAKESQKEVSKLSGAVTDLGAATEGVKSPAIEVPPIPAVDTAALDKAIADAALGTQEDLSKSWDKAGVVAGESLSGIGETTKDTFAQMGDQSDTMWERMTAAAREGAQNIASCFAQIGAAAAGVSNAHIQVSQVQMPHNASGTDNFAGGWTHINERGGEIAFLPGGSAILPADKSEQLIAGGSEGKPAAPAFSISFSFRVEGSADEKTIERAVDEASPKLVETIRRIYRELTEEDSAELAIQQAY